MHTYASQEPLINPHASASVVNFISGKAEPTKYGHSI